MNETSRSGEGLRAVMVLVATVGTIAFNGLSAAGYVNGVTPASISDKYPTIITPAGYAFSIWSLIYLGLLAFSVYQLLPRNFGRFAGVRTLYIASCLFNCGWIYFWHRDQIGICLVLIAGLALTLLVINIQFRTPVSLRDSLFTRAPFGLYFGWVTAATIVNLAVFMAYVDVRTSVVFGCISIAAASIAAFLVRWRLANFIYPLAVAWALGAIAVKQSGNTPVVLAAALGSVACLVISGSVVTNLKDSTSEQR